MNKYEEIIGLPHFVSMKHKHMSMTDRAAQFSAFKALSGHEEAISETARLTEDKIELDENMKPEIDRVICEAEMNAKLKPILHITYFVGDDKKSGGKYKEYSGNLKKIDDVFGVLIMSDGVKIAVDDIKTAYIEYV